ncbi:MAG: DUF5060 domain-containing protein [Deltaproteobacteria bacterium]|nr:DUF5060 domain-containing protein [Deltaproteobacteria bacterium]MBW2393968.1 DUF5060 domain-containing protein [Deltaproteobacteria bacterium]
MNCPTGLLGKPAGNGMVMSRQLRYLNAVRVLLLVVFAAFLAGCERPEPKATAVPSEGLPSIRGVLRIASYGPEVREGGASDWVHHQRWVRGEAYQGVEDNDLRGFLDGRFVYGWNQPGQIHSRVGRRPTKPRFGETELFRTLQRWDAVTLPALARVLEASLVIEVEDGPDRPLDVLLYSVKPDWNPGQGGTQRDNTSPPRTGEVWWNEIAHDELAWGLPGVGFASDEHALADTPVMALAEARWEPEQKHLRFESDALRAYAHERTRRGESLRFLVKLSDALEDDAGSLLYLYTADHGDLRNSSRRPILSLAWAAPSARVRQEHRVHLEAGRVVTFPRIELAGEATLAASFEATGASGRPTLQVRGGRGDTISQWISVEHPVDLLGKGWDWAELRVLAVRDPIELGSAFETSLHDTWVRTAAPTEQQVVFEFEAPRGEKFEVLAEYRGDYMWQIAFTPDEIGRWRYRFHESFLKRPYDSEEGVFDTVVLDRANARRQLSALADRLRAGERSTDEAPSPWAESFWRLERAAMRLETPESFASPSGRELFEVLTEVRTLLSHRRVPEELEASPMKREWGSQAP